MDIAQVSNFVRGIDFNITREMAALVSLENTTKGKHIFKSVTTKLARFV